MEGPECLKALRRNLRPAHGGGYAQHEASELARPLKIERYLDDRVVTFCRQYPDQAIRLLSPDVVN